MVNDTVIDGLTRMYNASRVNKRTVDLYKSNRMEAILKILEENGFIAGFEIEPIEGRSDNVKKLVVSLKYRKDESPMITKVKYFSKPGCRIYRGHEEVRKVKNGRGVGIYSTSQGVLSDKDTYQKGIGGEYLCEIW
jgi:small subunit ribosomal protein S8